MELELPKDVEVHSIGNASVSLPCYMVMLTQEELNELPDNKHELIIAAGFNKDIKELILLTGTGQIHTIADDVLKQILPAENCSHVLPTHHGTKLQFGICEIYAKDVLLLIEETMLNENVIK